MDDVEGGNPWATEDLRELFFLCCPKCPFVNQDEDEFVDHVLDEHPGDMILDDCFDSFERSELKQEPLDFLSEIETPKPRGKPGSDKCPICDIKFNVPILLESHLKVAHSSAAVSIKEEIKSENNSSSSKSQKPQKSRRFQCQECEKSFTSKSRLNSHTKTFHCALEPEVTVSLQKAKTKKKSPVMVMCDYCALKVHKKSLRAHQANAHGIGDKSFQCDQCLKTFFNSKSMKIHFKKVHLGIRNHICSHCGQGFKDSSTLRDHCVRAHQSVDDRTCKVCSEEFQSTVKLYVHVRSSHPDQDLDKLELPGVFPCKECDNVVGSRNALATHVKSVHRGVTYNCSVCFMTFRTPSGLFVHQRNKNHK